MILTRFNDIDFKYHKCNIQCKKCEEYSNDDSPKCLSCNNEQGYYPADNKPISLCYNRETIGNEYTLVEIYDEEKELYIKRWSICYPTCTNCFDPGNSTHQNCLSCKTRYYLLDDTTNCVTEDFALVNGYYYNSTYNKFLKCDKACLTCYSGPKNDNTNCIKCKPPTQVKQFWLIISLFSLKEPLFEHDSQLGWQFCQRLLTRK